ncbi:MAG: NosD domain-containing protein, partial [Planctomycetia bacterium]
GQVRLVGNTTLAGGGMAFADAVDGAKQLTVNTSGVARFFGAVGAATPLKGLVFQRANSVESYAGMRLDGRGLAPTANGLVIGRGVGSVTISTDDPVARPCVISGFGGSGILFQGGSQGSTIRGFTLTGNGQGITFLPGDYGGTSVASSTIVGSKRAGVALSGAQNLALGGAGDLANWIDGGAAPRLAGKGVVARGMLTGTRVVGNTITRNNGGIVMQNAHGITIGGAGLDNTVAGNIAWGLVATGNCTGSVIDANVFEGNTPGHVNVRQARGIVSTPI